MKYNLKESVIEFKPELESISVVVQIKETNDDISHPDGFQVAFLGESYTLGYDIDIINLLSSDQKDYVDELISTILPGTIWLITGEYILDMGRNILIVFPSEYQPVITQYWKQGFKIQPKSSV